MTCGGTCGSAGFQQFLNMPRSTLQALQAVYAHHAHHIPVIAADIILYSKNFKLWLFPRPCLPGLDGRLLEI